MSLATITTHRLDAAALPRLRDTGKFPLRILTPSLPFFPISGAAPMDVLPSFSNPYYTHQMP
jgi:hypothetical protein